MLLKGVRSLPARLKLLLQLERCSMLMRARCAHSRHLRCLVVRMQIEEVANAAVMCSQ